MNFAVSGQTASFVCNANFVYFSSVKNLHVRKRFVDNTCTDADTFSGNHHQWARVTFSHLRKDQRITRNAISK